MNDRARVSVIVPCYNQAAFLADAIGSLRRQTHEAWEAIVVDDGSTDQTPELAARLALEDSRVRLVRQPHQGLSAARNLGLDLAAGAYIQFLDSDDFLDREKLSSQLALLRSHRGLALAYCDYVFTDRAGRPISAPKPALLAPRFVCRRPLLDIALRWESELSIPVHCFLFDARLFRHHGVRFDVELHSHEDWDCWMQVFRLEPTIAHVPRQLAFYRQHGGSISRHPHRMWRGYRQAIVKHLGRCGDDSELREALRRKLRETADAYWDDVMASGWRAGVKRALDLGRHRVPWPIQRAVRRLLMR